MRTAPKEVREAGECRLPTSPCYLMRFEKDKGLQWIANARRDWRLSDGRPAVKAIAEAAGLNWQHMFKTRKAPTTPPDNKTMAHLVKLAAEAHSVPRPTAQARIFWFFDPDDARDVERLTTYLQPDEADVTELRAA